jgi:hypothetical protein
VSYIARHWVLVRVIIAYSLTNFLNGGLLVVIPLLAERSVGYGLGSKPTAVILLVFGIYCIVFNLTVFKPLVRLMGQKRANALGLNLVAFSILAFPLAAHLLPPGPGGRTMRIMVELWVVVIAADLVCTWTLGVVVVTVDGWSGHLG